MEPISFFDRIKYLFDIVFNSSFFIILFIIAIFTLILLIINVKTKNKVVKTITAVIYLAIILLIFVKYGRYLLDFGDTIVDKLFTAIYFPNYISYICMMLISILLLLFVLLNKNRSSFCKYSSVLSFSFLLFLFVLTIESIISNNIDITSKASIYSSDVLVILIQTSTIVFAIWITIFIISIVVDLIDEKNYNKAHKKNRNNKDVFNKLRIENILDVEEPQKMKDADFNKALEKFDEKIKFKNITK